MIRAAGAACLLALGACSGPSSSAPTGFGDTCTAGPRVSGTAEAGVSDRGLVSDLEGVTLSVGGGTVPGCAGASLEPRLR